MKYWLKHEYTTDHFSWDLNWGRYKLTKDLKSNEYEDEHFEHFGIPVKLSGMMLKLKRKVKSLFLKYDIYNIKYIGNNNYECRNTQGLRVEFPSDGVDIEVVDSVIRNYLVFAEMARKIQNNTYDKSEGSDYKTIDVCCTVSEKYAGYDARLAAAGGDENHYFFTSYSWRMLTFKPAINRENLASFLQVGYTTDISKGYLGVVEFFDAPSFGEEHGDVVGDIKNDRLAMRADIYYKTTEYRVDKCAGAWYLFKPDHFKNVVLHKEHKLQIDANNLDVIRQSRFFDMTEHFLLIKVQVRSKPSGPSFLGIDLGKISNSIHKVLGDVGIAVLSYVYPPFGTFMKYLTIAISIANALNHDDIQDLAVVYDPDDPSNTLAGLDGELDELDKELDLGLIMKKELAPNI
jgi:hypothetical protein